MTTGSIDLHVVIILAQRKYATIQHAYNTRADQGLDSHMLSGGSDTTKSSILMQHAKEGTLHVRSLESIGPPGKTTGEPNERGVQDRCCNKGAGADGHVS